MRCITRLRRDVLPKWLALSLIATAFPFASNSTVLAQELQNAAIGGLQPVLPVVPRQDRRPAEDPDAGKRLNTLRPDAENEPVASFIDSLKGNDAAFRVVVGQGRLLTLRQPIAEQGGVAVIAVGDPTVVDFEVLPNPRMIRIIGRRAGITDLSITTTDDQVYSFEVHVGYDLDLLQAHLTQIFPDARVRLAQLREHLVVEGQARSAAQVTQILQSVEAYLDSVQTPLRVDGSDGSAGELAPGDPAAGDVNNGGVAPWRTVGGGDRPDVDGSFVRGRIINLLRVPGVQQVMLQVRIAELNRTGLREIGADIRYADGGTLIETVLGNAVDATVFGVFDSGNLDISLKALRRNGLVNVLAEPNLVAMSGHEANFLAGGEFPIAVPQNTGGFNTTTFTVEFKDFGVQLNFLPFVQDDESIRLSVAPEVSEINFSLATPVGIGLNEVPGITTRRASTTVELRQGQTLAIAGLLQVQLDARTDRIPGLGDLPYIGPLFSNTSHQRMEKELLVLVTPYLVSPMECDQVPPLPGSEIGDPTDCEFYLLNRIENRNGRPFRATTSWDFHDRFYQFEQRNVWGPCGFSDCLPPAR